MPAAHARDIRLPASSVGTERRRRPKDRKAQIARVAAETFSEVGYHGVSMEGIARRVGVTAASLYRHYSGKYELFAASVLGLGQQLVDCTAIVDDDDAGPDQVWDGMVSALIDTALANRTSGGLYRWEGRYLDGSDQVVLNEQIKLVNHRLQQPMSKLRPDLEPRQDRWILSAAVLSVLGSITDHHAQLPSDRIHATLATIARDVRDTDLPAELSGHHIPARATVGPESGEYEQILHSAILLFNERGYRDTGMDDIAVSVGVSTTSLYRYFPGKATILGTAYRRAADRVSSDLAAILPTADGPRDAVGRLVEAFVLRFFANPELAYLYYAERLNVPAEDRVALQSIQRATVDAWARQVSAARPDMSPDEARFAVHAGFVLVTDLGRFMHATHTRSAPAVVRHLLLVTLLGRSAP